jgi:putative SOS response-associated peptidase YedK
VCGRYAYTDDPDAVPEEFSVVKILPTREELAALHNIAPTMLAPVVFQESGTRVLDRFLWSFIAPWSKDGKPGDLATFNARDDRVAESKLYGPSFKSKRCIVPARGFYEWQGAKTPKQPYYIRRVDNHPLGLAGLWSIWTPKDGGEALRSFTIITTNPNAVCEPIHHRMPVVLDRADFATWLDPHNHDIVALRGLLKPCPNDVLIAHMIPADVPKPGGRHTKVVASAKSVADEPAPAKPKRPKKSKPDDTGLLF